MRKRFPLVALILLSPWAAAARPAPAQQVPILNPSFDTNLAGWTQHPAGSANLWPGEDADGCLTGAALLGNNFDLVIALRQCVPLSGAGPLTVLARGSVSTGGSADLNVSFYSDSACTALIAQELTSTTSWSWTPLRLDLPALPAGTSSIRISLEALNDNSAVQGAFDEVRVARAPLLFADGFEVGNFCRWSARAESGS